MNEQPLSTTIPAHLVDQPTMIHVDGVSKSFGNAKAVRDLSLDVRRGEFFGFLGLNGAGKTTTIKMAVGLLRPDAGRIIIGGLDVGEKPQQVKSRLGYIPDEPYIYEKLSGREFLRFVGGLYGMQHGDIERRTEFLFWLFGVGNWGDLRAEGYSHGMRQKIVMSAAFIHSPEVVILDEPLVGLDPQSGKLVKDMLKLMSQEGTTIFMSTHTLSVAEELCDRIGIIHKGVLSALGTVDEIKQLSEGGSGSLESAFLDLMGGSIQARLYNSSDAALETPVDEI